MLLYHAIKQNVNSSAKILSEFPRISVALTIRHLALLSCKETWGELKIGNYKKKP
jgi:hypothetical protein